MAKDRAIQCMVPLHRAVWCFRDLNAAHKKHPTLGPTLRICSWICMTTSLSPTYFPLYPIVGNQCFPLGLQDGPFRKLLDSQCYQASHFATMRGDGPLLSQMYALLVASPDKYVPPFLKKWKTALERTLSPLQQRQIIHSALKSSIFTRAQETNFKLLTLYHRPSLLHKYSPSISDKCWRCQVDKGTLLHIFWACPKLEVLLEGGTSNFSEIHRLHPS